MATSRYFFIHNVLANFYKDFLDYLCTNEFYERFNSKYVGTYDKAVQYMHDKNEHGREHDKPNLPAIILNPTGDINLADGQSTGKQFHRFSQYTHNLNLRLYDPLYQDEDVMITPGYGRIKGEIEVSMLLNSFYEYCDVRLLFLQHFRGDNTYKDLGGFISNILIPEEIYEMEYTNDVTGETHTLDWSEYNTSVELIKTTNQTEYIYPCFIKPQIKMTGLTDGSTRFGGSDNLADWRLTANFEFEMDIPWYMIITSDYLVENIETTINSLAYNYSVYANDIPTNRDIIQSSYNWDFDSTTSMNTQLDEMETTLTEDNLLLNTRYAHIITSSEAESEDNWSITIPEAITDNKLLYLNSKAGKMSYGDHYILENDGNKLTIISDNVSFIEDDVLEIYVYIEQI